MNEYIVKEKDKTGKIFLNKEAIDSESLKQVKSMIRHEAIHNARVMPDCHKSMGCCVGFTSKIIDKIVPNFVGGDIGCGITTYPLSDFNESKLKQFDKFIRNIVPFNFQSVLYGKPTDYLSDTFFDDALDRIYHLSNIEVSEFIKLYKEELCVDISELKPIYDKEWFELLAKKVKSSDIEIKGGLGTLGGGNHFIEINKSLHNEQKYLTVHSGSRALGKKICEYHQSIIKKGREFDFKYFDSETKEFNKTTKNKKERQRFQNELREKLDTNKHPLYLMDEEAVNYYFDMIFAQKYAVVNRELMISNSIRYLDLVFDPELKIESIHNYIDFTDFIMRKGAINAHKGKECIIALNMKDGILLCEGLGNEDWNYSSAHGAGRIITRTKAINNCISMEKKMKAQLEEANVYTSSDLKYIVDEAPDCYKETDLIKETIGNSVIIKEQLVPILNIKSGIKTD